LEEDYSRIGGELEQDWRRTRAGLEEDYSRIGGGLEQNWRGTRAG